MRAIDPHAPVCHLSYFEADAFARWAGARLPTESEWEVRRRDAAGARATSSTARARTRRAAHVAATRLQQMFGDVWEWTARLRALPRLPPAAGALGEYNGKFMCNQFVLRGGSCATPRHHIRASYRNFFPPDARWQFTGCGWPGITEHPPMMPHAPPWHPPLASWRTAEATLSTAQAPHLRRLSATTTSTDR